jgi:hypothetical protein
VQGAGQLTARGVKIRRVVPSESELAAEQEPPIPLNVIVQSPIGKPEENMASK